MKDTTPRAPAEILHAGILSEGLGCLSNWGDLWKEAPQVTERAETGIKHGGKTRVGSHPLLTLSGRREKEREQARERERNYFHTIQI